MRRSILISLLSAAAVLLTACATSADRSLTMQSPKTIEPDRAKSFEPDHAYISAVNRAARAKGVEVVWVNQPLVR